MEQKIYAKEKASAKGNEKQSSIREPNLTNRTFHDVPDRLSFAALHSGFRRAFMEGKPMDFELSIHSGSDKFSVFPVSGESRTGHPGRQQR